MNKIFIIRVEKPSKNSNEPFKKLYERQIPFDDSLTFPYSSLYSSMRFFYGDAAWYHLLCIELPFIKYNLVLI